MPAEFVPFDTPQQPLKCVLCGRETSEHVGETCPPPDEAATG